MTAVKSGAYVKSTVPELLVGFDREFPLLEEETIRSLRLCNVTQWFDGDAAGIQTHERAVEAGILSNHSLAIHHLFMTKDIRSVERVEGVGRGTVTRHPVLQGGGALGFFSPRALSAVREEARRIFRENGINLVHIRCPGTPMGNAVARVARDMDIPIVLTHHFGRRTEPGKSLVELCVLPSTRRMAAVSLGVAGETSSVLKGAVYIGNGVDTGYFNPDNVSDEDFRRKYPRTDGGKVILDVARISKTKDQLDLLEAYALLPEETRREAALVFVGGVQPGEEGYLRRLENRAAELGVSGRVVITGNMSPSEVRQAYKRADVVVLASRMEGTPRTVLEAGAMKKTVIATDVGGTHEAVVDGVTGYLVPPNDPAALAGRMASVLASPEGAARTGEAARSHVERYFSMDGLAERHLRVYSKVLRRGGAGTLKAV